MYVSSRGKGYVRPGTKVIPIPRMVRKGVGGVGLGIPVNIGPGTVIDMSPADAAAWWGTNVPAPGTGTPSGPYGGYAGTGFRVTGASGGGPGNPFGIYQQAAMDAYLHSPTIQSLIPATPQNLTPTGFTPGSPRYVQTPVAGISGTTTVMDLDSYLQQLLSEMTSRKGQSSASDIAQQAAGYCALYPGACQGQDVNGLVNKYTNWFNTWNNETLVAGVDPARGVVMNWSGQSPTPGVTWLGQAPSGALPGQTLNYGPGGQAGGLPGVYTPGGYVDATTGKPLANQWSYPGGYGGAAFGSPLPQGPGAGSSGASGSGPQGPMSTQSGAVGSGSGGPGGSAGSGGSGGGVLPAAFTNPVSIGGVSVPPWVLALAAGLLFLL